MKQPDVDTFCVAPWFQIRNGNDGTKRVCCGIKSKRPDSVEEKPLEFLNSSDNIELKKKLHEGTKAKQCEECWYAEDQGRVSLRQKLNGVLTNNASSIDKTWIDSYFRHKTDFTSEDVLMADIKMGNTCNYACVMCVPEDSSMIYNDWHKKPNAFFIKEKLKKDPGYLDRIKNTGYRNQKYRQYVKNILSNKKLKYLKLLGGEPLLDRRLLTELRSLPEQQKQKLSLYIVTNGSKDLVATKEYLGNFKSIMFTVSLEGTSRVQDYARYGSIWSTVSANIVNFKKLFPSDVIIHTVLQTTTILGLKDLAEWAKKYNLALSVGLCQQPLYLSFLSLPDAVREQVKKSLLEAKITISQNTVGDEDCWPIEKLIDTMEQTQFDPTQYKKFLDYIRWYENGKNIPNLKEIFPSLFIDKYQ
jgi:molybdenum cofactor biosynthesis enzyme MoaA